MGVVREVITCLYIFGGNCFSLAILCPVYPRCILKVPTHKQSVTLELHLRLQVRRRQHRRRRLFVLRATSQNEVLFFKRGRAEEPPGLHPSYCRASLRVVSFGLLFGGFVREVASLSFSPLLFSGGRVCPLGT